MKNVILNIEEVDSFKCGEVSTRYDGYNITTTLGSFQLGVSNDASCCESFGYLASTDDLSEFIGAELFDVFIGDVNINVEYNPKYQDCGDAMYVNLSTSNGTLQLTCYNHHNGYYGHSAVVISGGEIVHRDSL